MAARIRLAIRRGPPLSCRTIAGLWPRRTLRALDRVSFRIEKGETIALVSDAGMPVISDPGYRLVRLARNKGWLVAVI